MPTDLMDWVQITGLVVLPAVGWVGMSLRRVRLDIQERVESVAGAVADNAKTITDEKIRVMEMDADHDGRLGILEAKFESLDVKTEIHKVHARVDQLTKSQGAMEGEMKAIGKNVELISTHLLDKST